MTFLASVYDGFLKEKFDNLEKIVHYILYIGGENAG